MSILKIASLCMAHGCVANASKKCVNCNTMLYCSPDCQKADWKMRHKKECQFKLPAAPPVIFRPGKDRNVELSTIVSALQHAIRFTSPDSIVPLAAFRLLGCAKRAGSEQLVLHLENTEKVYDVNADAILDAHKKFGHPEFIAVRHHYFSKSCELTAALALVCDNLYSKGYHVVHKGMVCSRISIVFGKHIAAHRKMAIAFGGPDSAVEDSQQHDFILAMSPSSNSSVVAIDIAAAQYDAARIDTCVYDTMPPHFQTMGVIEKEKLLPQLSANDIALAYITGLVVQTLDQLGAQDCLRTVSSESFPPSEETAAGEDAGEDAGDIPALATILPDEEPGDQDAK